jgi:hypothetical protein
MKVTRSTTAPAGIVQELVDAVARVLAFGRSGANRTAAPAPAPQPSWKAAFGAGGRKSSASLRKRIGAFQRFSGRGAPPLEIARRTRLSQEAVAMLTYLDGNKAAESAARGSFFRARGRREGRRGIRIAVRKLLW